MPRIIGSYMIKDVQKLYWLNFSWLNAWIKIYSETILNVINTLLYIWNEIWRLNFQKQFNSLGSLSSSSDKKQEIAPTISWFGLGECQEKKQFIYAQTVKNWNIHAIKRIHFDSSEYEPGYPSTYVFSILDIPIWR